MLDETNLYVDGSKDRQTDRLTHRRKLILLPARDLKKKANLKWKGKAKRGQDKNFKPSRLFLVFFQVDI